MNPSEMAQQVRTQRALLAVAQARTRRAETLCRRTRAQWREHSEALQAERRALLTLDTEMARIRLRAQPNAGQPAIAAGTLLAWRDHAQEMLRLRGEQNDKVRTAAEIAREAREQVRQVARKAVQANVRQQALGAHVALIQMQRVAGADERQAEEQNDSVRLRSAQNPGGAL